MVYNHQQIEMAEIVLIYIAGYGRSGSTLLERILASHETIWGTGELAMLPRLLDDEQARCSCGQPIRKCEFWGKVIANLKGLSAEKWSASAGKVESVLGVFFCWGRSRIAHTYRDVVQVVLRAIREALPAGIGYVVDSSKTARQCWLRPLALAKYAGIPVKVIHLVRDGRGCMWSQLRGSNRRMERGEPARQRIPALRTTFSWPLANLGAHLFQLRYPDHYLRIRYEDFVNDPAGTLKRFETFLGVSFDRQIEMLRMCQDIPLGHQVAGNRLRAERKIVLRADEEWQARLGRGHRLLFWITCWPFALLYGYRPWRRRDETP